MEDDLQKKTHDATLAYLTKPSYQSSIFVTQNKNTKEIIRHGSGQSCPCHVYPEIFPITQIALDQFNVDVEKFQGTIFVDPAKS